MSAFETMTDTLFRQYQARGIANRDDVIIPKDYRDAHPVTNWGMFDPLDWVTVKKIALNVAPFLLFN